MIGEEVSLEEMLEARERRVSRQKALLKNYGRTLVCFTMNIAGPVKNNDLISAGFYNGCKMLDAQLREAGIKKTYKEIYCEKTGNEAYYVVDAEAEKILMLTEEMEDACALGRLFDMDVLNTRGEHIGRKMQGRPERKCLICENKAKVCSCSRRHSVNELQAKTEELLEKSLKKEKSHFIAQLACRSLLHEVLTTPKPGLVDRENNGSHNDMDCFTFLSSLLALWPYFEQAANLGMETSYEEPKETFRRLTFPAKMAEQTMLKATGGVNTHKGAIFSIGILCAALGRIPKSYFSDSGRVLSECAAMATGVVERDFSGITEKNAKTMGEKLYVQYGITGIRSQAEAGFPEVLSVGLPKLEEGLNRGLSFNDAGCAVLLALMASVTDTNLIARSDRETQLAVKKQIASLLQKDPFPSEETLRAIDCEFQRKNLSPGGSADLLAMTYFLYFLKHGEE